MRKFLLMLTMTGLAASAWAEVKVGNGTLSVQHSNGTIEPIGAYIEWVRTKQFNVCDLYDVYSQYDKTAATKTTNWRKYLNLLADKVFVKNVGAGYLLEQSFRETEFYFLDLAKDEKLVFTDDNNSVIAASKSNLAVRVGLKVYILRAGWEKMERVVHEGYPMANQVHTVTHEVLEGHYKFPTTEKLDEVVAEMLRLAGFFPKHGDDDEYEGMSAHEVGVHLASHGLTTVNPGMPFTDDFGMKLLWEPLPPKEPGSNYSNYSDVPYKSEAFKSMKDNFEKFESDKEKYHLYLNDHDWTVSSIDDLNAIPEGFWNGRFFRVGGTKADLHVISYDTNQNSYTSWKHVLTDKPIICK